MSAPDFAKIDELIQWASDQKDIDDQGLPSEWHQQTYWQGESDKLDATCGTVCCLAGKACYDAGLVEYGEQFYDDGSVETMVVVLGYPVYEYSDPWFDAASDILGLDEDSAFDLFYENNTLEDLKVIRDRIALKYGAEERYNK